MLRAGRDTFCQNHHAVQELQLLILLWIVETNQVASFFLFSNLCRIVNIEASVLFLHDKLSIIGMRDAHYQTTVQMGVQNPTFRPVGLKAFLKSLWIWVVNQLMWSQNQQRGPPAAAPL